jgi:hypothetical protein
MRIKPGLLIIGATGMAGALLALLFRDELIAAIKIPYSYAVLFGRAVLAGTPQIVIWGVLVSIGALIFLSGSLSRRRKRTTEGPKRPVQRGRVEHWIRLVHEVDRGDYFQWRLTHQLSELVLHQLAFKLKRPVSDIRQMLPAGEIDLAPELLEYLRVGLAGRATEFLSGEESSSRVTDLNAERILDFLESEI